MPNAYNSPTASIITDTAKQSGCVFMTRTENSATTARKYPSYTAIAMY